MTWKDKLELGLKEDAPFRRDNLPPREKSPDGPERKPDDPTRSPEEPGARERKAEEHVDLLPGEDPGPRPDERAKRRDD